MEKYTKPMIAISLFSEENIAATASAVEVEAKGEELINKLNIQVDAKKYEDVFQFN